MELYLVRLLNYYTYMDRPPPLNYGSLLYSSMQKTLLTRAICLMHYLILN
jgi:hypothetical protein